MKREKKKFVFMLFILCAISTLFLTCERVQAATKEYGIIIAKKDGSYKLYDLNLAKGNQRIEKNEKGQLMIPLKRVCSYFDDLSYQFDFAIGQATVTNCKTKTRLVLKESQKYGYVYKKGSSKGKKVTLSAKSYRSSDSNAMMVSMSALKYVFSKEAGYQYYDVEAIREAGYDASSYQGIIVYNQYKKVTGLIHAKKVSYVPIKIESNAIKVTIPEGYSIPQIVNLLTEKGVCVSSAAVYQAMDSVDFSKYKMFSDREMNEHICFLLEGYLYPDTYQFYKNMSPDDVLAKILKNTEKKYSAYEEQAKALGYRLDELLSIASIIEKEVGIEEEMEKVSSVLHTRLEQNWKIQCDATIYYVERYIKPYITGDKDRYNEYYNTYKCSALPSGPICNPGKKAILAALNPSKESYLFFATDDEGTYYYASTREEYMDMRDRIARRNAEISEEKKRK